MGLKAYAVGSDNKPRFKRRPFPVTAEAAQSPTARRDAVLSLFEGQSLGQIVSMVRNNNSDGSGGDQNYSAEDVRTHACKILANLAAIDEHKPALFRRIFRAVEQDAPCWSAKESAPAHLR